MILLKTLLPEFFLFPPKINLNSIGKNVDGILVIYKPDLLKTVFGDKFTTLSKSKIHNYIDSFLSKYKGVLFDWGGGKSNKDRMEIMATDEAKEKNKKIVVIDYYN